MSIEPGTSLITLIIEAEYALFACSVRTGLFDRSLSLVKRFATFRHAVANLQTTSIRHTSFFGREFSWNPILHQVKLRFQKWTSEIERLNHCYAFQPRSARNIRCFDKTMVQLENDVQAAQKHLDADGFFTYQMRSDWQVQVNVALSMLLNRSNGPVQGAAWRGDVTAERAIILLHQILRNGPLHHGTFGKTVSKLMSTISKKNERDGHSVKCAFSEGSEANCALAWLELNLLKCLQRLQQSSMPYADVCAVLSFTKAVWDGWRVNTTNLRYSGQNSNWQPCNEIGRGPLGVVFRGSLDLMSTGQTFARRARVAIKSIPVDPSLVPKLRVAAILLSSLRHPNILSFYGANLPAPPITSQLEGAMPVLQGTVPVGSFPRGPGQANALFVTEEMTHSLPSAKGEEALGDNIAKLRILRDVARGLVYLHSHGLAHGSLTPSNVLLHIRGGDIIGNSKISDTAVSQLLMGDSTKRMMLTRNNVPNLPSGLTEVAADIWGFGLIMCYCLSSNSWHLERVRNVWHALETFQGGLARLNIDWARRIGNAEAEKIALKCFSVLNGKNITVAEILDDLDVLEDSFDVDNSILCAKGKELLLNPHSSPRDLKQAFENFVRAQDLGITDGVLWAGKCYLQGRGVKRDRKKGFTLVQRAMQKGSVDASVELGNCYRFGHGTAKDLRMAAEMFEDLCSGGNLEAMNILGKMRELGSQEVDQSFLIAYQLFQKSAEGGNSTGVFNVGRCYEHGYGVLKDGRKAVQLYTKAANMGCLKAKFKLGICFEKGFYVKQSLERAAHQFGKSAELGDAASMNRLGHLYLHGRGVKRNATKAADRFFQAMEMGNVEACSCLARCYLNGHGVGVDKKKAFELFQLAVHDCDPNGLNGLGECFERGIAVKPSLGRALKLYEMAANHGLPLGRYNLGRCYEKGLGISRNMELALENYYAAAKKGEALALLKLGRLHMQGVALERNLQKGARLLQLAAEACNSDALVELGRCHYAGIGVSRNVARSVSLFRRAALDGNAFGQFELGCCYHNGTGVVKDYELAAKYYRFAGQNGNVAAKHHLGSLLKQGRGVPRDLEAAFRYFKEAADAEFVPAQLSLAFCFQSGEGTAQNFFRAYRLYRKAASTGNETAKCYLGYCYLNGYGTDIDIDTAFDLFASAANSGVPLAKYYLGLCLQDGVGTDRDILAARNVFVEAANGGIAAAQTCLGILYLKGADGSIERDAKKAMEWLHLACRSGVEPRAKQLLRDCYFSANPDNGVLDFIAENTEKAITFYEESGQNGFADGFRKLGDVYKSGNVVGEDIVRAIQYYRSAAQAGDVAAMNSLGLLLKKKKGGNSIAVAEAAQWFQKASDMGYVPAHHRLAQCFEAGCGVDKNEKKALRLFRKAAAEGSEKAKQALADRYSREVSEYKERAMKKYGISNASKPLKKKRLGKAKTKIEQ